MGSALGPQGPAGGARSGKKKVKLTQRVIEGLTCAPARKDMLVADDGQRGLYIRVTRVAGAGSLKGKNYLVKYTVHGRKQKVPLGSCASLSLGKAREAARAILGEVAKGIDPAAERASTRAAARRKAVEAEFTLAKLLDDWRELHLCDKRAGYAAEALRALHRAFEKHLDKAAIELARADVVRTLDGLKKSGLAAMAARTAAYGRAAFGWAMKRGAMPANPFADLPHTPTAKRDRVLSDGELAAIWRAAERAGVFGHIVRMLILSGQRRDEVAGMGWRELSGDLATWTIPAARAKNGAVHIVPLSEEARELLGSLPRSGELAFPGLRGPFNGWSKAKVALDNSSGVHDWRLHDLRRTMATGLQRLGVRLEVTEAVLNHVAGSRAGIIGVYQRHDWADEKRAALAAWGRHVRALVEGQGEADNLIMLPQRGAA